MNKWDQRFLQEAEHIASWSKDKSTKVGCIITDQENHIISTGYNGFPTGANDDIPERHERPEKYLYTEHAERNAIYTAARLGIRLKDAKLYLSNGLCICIDCARAVIQSGISEVYIPAPTKATEVGKRWFEENIKAVELLTECGVKINYHEKI